MRCSRSTLGFKLFCLTAVLLLASAGDAGAADRYFIQGKPVSNQMFQAASLVNEGVGLMRANRNQDAVTKLSQAVELAPELAEAHHNLGLALAKVGRMPEAVEQLRATLALRADLDSTWLTLGGLYQSMGQLDEAVKVYRQFLSKFPTNDQASKITSLVKGLESELKKQQAMAPAGSGAGRGAGPDYYTEVTRQGTLRWPSFRQPLRVFIKPGTGVAAFRPAMEDILRQSFADWSEASGGRVRFTYVNDPAHADIECSWINEPKQLANTAEAGEARVFTDKDGIMRGTIQLLTVPLSPDVPLTDNRVRINCLHEIGHVLGLAGHTTNPEDIMFYSSSITDQWRNLSTRDCNTLIRLYSN